MVINRIEYITAKGARLFFGKTDIIKLTIDPLKKILHPKMAAAFPDLLGKIYIAFAA